MTQATKSNSAASFHAERFGPFDAAAFHCETKSFMEFGENLLKAKSNKCYSGGWTNARVPSEDAGCGLMCGAALGRSTPLQISIHSQSACAKINHSREIDGEASASISINRKSRSGEEATYARQLSQAIKNV
jgi:hypothetical protein